jgi:hypothetical protein
VVTRARLSIRSIESGSCDGRFRGAGTVIIVGGRQPGGAGVA